MVSKLNSKTMLSAIVYIVLGLLVICCGFVVFVFLRMERYTNPENVSADSIVGQWTTKHGRDRDEIRINADGTFHQEYQIAGDDYVYEHNGEWHFEYLDDGRVYMHLVNGRCYLVGPHGLYFDHMIDPISYDSVDVRDRLVLLIQENQHHEIVLNHLLRGADDAYMILETGGAEGYKLDDK